MDDYTLSELCQLAALTPGQAASLCGKGERQWRRYRNGEAPIPRHVYAILALKAGTLGHIHPAWSGWQLNPLSGDLVDPFGRTYSATWHEKLHWHFEKLRAQRARLRERIRQLEQDIESLTRQRGPILASNDELFFSQKKE